MARKIISFDCDGVITGDGFVPPEDRNNKFYCKMEPQEDALPSLHWLSTMYDIYIISRRSHTDANLGLRAWLHWVLGLELDTIAGVITGYNESEIDKAAIVQSIGCVAHFDDDPHHLVHMPVGVLFPSAMPSSQAAVNKYPTVAGWAGVREFLTTPGMVLSGFDGDVVRTIVSPAEVMIPDPAKEIMVQ